MSAYALPSHVLSAIEAEFVHRPRASIMAGQSQLSEAYRSGRPSSEAVRTDEAALAYVAARMPATFASMTRALEEIEVLCPDFQPSSVLDIGAGPGTATFAAMNRWQSIENARFIEPNSAMRAIAQRLFATGPLKPDFAETLGTAPVDLALFGYVLVEQPLAQAVRNVEATLAVSRMTVIVEPGTPEGFARINAIREAVRHNKTHHILAPCTHSVACPMRDGQWCHFNVRLPRTRLHQSIKAAEAPFEDERFTYLVLSRDPPSDATGTWSRTMADPRATKATVTLKVCNADGLGELAIPTRDRPAAKHAKGTSWGDRLSNAALTRTQAPSIKPK
ncbi:MAG: hypothetical protein RL291_1426 [Pseudomonadota bacterium]